MQNEKTIVSGTYPAEAIFHEWFDANIHRFKHQPLLQENGEDYAVYSFKGITEGITLCISFELLESVLYFDNFPGFHDDTIEGSELYILSYIEEVAHDPLKGYYATNHFNNRLEDEDEHVYFATEKTLYIDMLFEAILVDLNKMFLPENSLYLINYGEMTTGFIARTESDPDYIAREAKGVGIPCCHQFRANKIGTPTVKGGYELHKYSLFM
jgi:hypothetical protein